MRFCLLILVLFPLFFYAQIPEYYRSIDFSKPAVELKADLNNLLVNTHNYNLIYTPDVWDAILETDMDLEDPNSILLIYGSDNTDNYFKTDRTRDARLRCDFSGDCTGLWNREHVFARSLATPKLILEGAGTDVHAIRACDSEMNSWRSNRVFGNGRGYAHITSKGHFYPGDEWKGDVARMIMYMYLRYPNQCNPRNIANINKNELNEMPNVFLQWNVEDPPSYLEMRRNDIIQKKYQGNRNPFIDNPYIAYLLWGGSTGLNTWANAMPRNKLNDTPTAVEVYDNKNQNKHSHRARGRNYKSFIYISVCVITIFGFLLLFIKTLNE